MKTLYGKVVKQELQFDEKGTFQSLYAAQKWCHDNGYSYGSLARNEPVAIMKGEYELPQKWFNISDEDRELVDGLILSNDFREGILKILLF